MRLMLGDMEFVALEQYFEVVDKEDVALRFNREVKVAKGARASGLKKIVQRLKIARLTKIWEEFSIAYLLISRPHVIDKLYEAGYRSMPHLLDDGPEVWKAIPGIGEELAHEILTALNEAITIEVAVSPERPKLEFKNPPKPLSKRAQAKAKKLENDSLQPAFS